MSRRIDRVNELLRREISTVIQHDYEWHGKMVTVSAVEVTDDLKEGRVWIGVRPVLFHSGGAPMGKGG